VAWPTLLAAEVRLDVAGSVSSSEEGLEIRVDIRNGGDSAATSIDVEGRLFANEARGQLPDGLAPGASGSVALRFPPAVPQPGVHALTLLLDYAGPGPSGPVSMSQRAYLLVALGGAAEPVLRLSVANLRMAWSGLLCVVIESADGAPHRVRLQVDGPRGLRADNPAHAIDVPARGTVRVPVRVFRGTVPWDSRQGVIVVAAATDGPLVRTTVATAVVQVAADPAWSPWLRKPLTVLVLVLLGLVALAEARRWLV
jgi:hypothetical protein